MIFEMSVTPLPFGDYRELQEKKKQFFQQGWKSTKTTLKILIFYCFPSSTMI